MLLYWQIGHDILARQAQQGWGTKMIERLAQDLRAAFPDMKGFSPRNLKYMRAFAQAWPDAQFVQQAVAQLPWGHNLVLLESLNTPEERRWYAAKALEHNWSRNVLNIQIETRLQARSDAAITNFAARLPKPQSDLARESLKDPYRFDFLGFTTEAQEREIEHALVKHVTEFLLELGADQPIPIPCHLLAGVEIVATYKLHNLNRIRLENPSRLHFPVIFWVALPQSCPARPYSHYPAQPHPETCRPANYPPAANRTHHLPRA